MKNKNQLEWTVWKGMHRLLLPKSTKLELINFSEKLIQEIVDEV
ncbi:hypothetical protein [Pedobacter sp.]